MGLQTARYLGAKRVIAVGRNKEKLERLDADVKIAIDEDAERLLLAEFKQGVDVVLDFLWGDPGLQVLKAATQGRGSRTGEPRVRFVQLGTIAGEEIPIRGDMLRSSGLELLGSGIGSVSSGDLLAGAGEMLAAAPSAGFEAPGVGVPLQSVQEAWNGDPNIRYILTPQ